jgi:PIN domain nuclease of toxin-antitoxin system
MDPYLEGNLWAGFHFLFAAEIVRELNRNLGPHYVAQGQQRFVMTIPGEITVARADIYPDISIAHKGKKKQSGKGTAVLEAPVRMDTVMPVRVPHTWIKILDVAKRKLVAVIEFLSPANKRGLERSKYLRKRQRILLSSAHLMEIDLLRKGKRIPMQTPLPAAEYFVLLSRAQNRPETEIWPIGLDQALPNVPLPLLSKDADEVLDLEKIFTAVYDEGRYHALIDYSQEPDIPLPKESMAWLKKCLKWK